MKIKEIDLSSLSRQEYINLIVIILNSFLLDYESFTMEEKEIIANVIIGYKNGKMENMEVKEDINNV